MKHPSAPFLVLAAISIALLLAPLGARDASACVAIGRLGPVRIEGEEALIVWDAERRKQHFVRTAGFQAADADFGFLVPTPARPELAEVAEGVFDRLFAIYSRPPPRARGVLSVTAGSGQAQSVEVLERRTVAGLDASVLRADDAGALVRWLRRHGYPSSPRLRGWLAPYVREGWIVTAFRIDPREHRGRGFATRALRMSFDAAVPFFPYSEPPDPGAEPRPFRVSVVAPTRMRVRDGTAAWSGRVGYAGRPGAALVSALEGVVPPASMQGTPWLTVFDEPRSARGTQDLYFEPDPSTVALPSTIFTRIDLGAR